MSGPASSSASAPPRYDDVARCVASQPLKPAKKYRPDSDGDRQIVRCKRKLDFIPDEARESGKSRGGRGGRGARRAASVARRNERERNRVSLINRTFEILRDQLPASLWGHRNLAKVSKVETLRAAIGYIRTLEDLLATDDVSSDATVKDSDQQQQQQLVEMLSSAERLAELAAGDEAHPDVVSSPHRLHQFSTHAPSNSTSFQATASAAAASACERLEHLSGGTATHVVDIHSATRRLARLTAPTHDAAVTQPSFYNSEFPGSPPPQSLQSDDVHDPLLFLDINSNYDNPRQATSRLKPTDDDNDVIIRQFVIGDNFLLDNLDFSATTVGS